MTLFCPACQKTVTALKNSAFKEGWKHEAWNCPDCLMFLASSDSHEKKKT